MKGTGENLEMRRWVMMAVGETKVVVLPCLFGVCEYASMKAFVFLFLLFLGLFVGGRQRR